MQGFRIVGEIIGEKSVILMEDNPPKTELDDYMPMKNTLENRPTAQIIRVERLASSNASLEMLNLCEIKVYGGMFKNLILKKYFKKINFVDLNKLKMASHMFDCEMTNQLP